MLSERAYLVAVTKLFALHHAPFFKSLKDLAEYLEIRRAKLYEYRETDFKFGSTLDNLLASDLHNEAPKFYTWKEFQAYVKEQEGKGLVLEATPTRPRKEKKPRTAVLRETKVKKKIIIEVPREPRRGNSAQLQTTANDRYILVKAIIKLVDQGLSVQEACKTADISVTSFYTWVNPQTFKREGSEELVALWQAAKAKRVQSMDDSFIIQAREVLNQHLHDRQVVEVTRKVILGKPKKGETEGKMTEVERTEKTKIREASLAASMFALKSLDANYSDKNEQNVEEEKQVVRYLTDEELDAKIAETRKSLMDNE